MINSLYCHTTQSDKNVGMSYEKYSWRIYFHANLAHLNQAEIRTGSQNHSYVS